MLLGGPLRDGGVGLGSEGVIEVWGGLRAKFGQGLPCLDAIFLLEIFLCGSSGTCEKGLSGEVIFGGWEDLRSKFGQGFPCLEAFFCVRNDGRLLWYWGV